VHSPASMGPGFWVDRLLCHQDLDCSVPGKVYLKSASVEARGLTSLCLDPSWPPLYNLVTQWRGSCVVWTVSWGLLSNVLQIQFWASFLTSKEPACLPSPLACGVEDWVDHSVLHPVQFTY
jgi:hypothetical protein